MQYQDNRSKSFSIVIQTCTHLASSENTFARWPKMAAMFIFGEGRFVLFLFVMSYPQLVGHVGLQSISPTHPGFQDDPGGLKKDSKDSEMVFLNHSTSLSIHNNSRSTPVCHASMHPCPSLHDSGIVLLWSRPKYSIPFRPG